MNNHDVKPETMQAIAFGNLSNSHIHAQFHMIRSLCTIVFYHILSYDIIYLLHHTCASDLFTYLQTAFSPSSNPACQTQPFPGYIGCNCGPARFVYCLDSYQVVSGLKIHGSSSNPTKCSIVLKRRNHPQNHRTKIVIIIFRNSCYDILG